VLELLHNLRRKRLQKLNRRMGDLTYLCSIGLDAKDAQLAKEKGHIENRIAHWDVKLTTAKFLHDKVYLSFSYRANVHMDQVLYARHDIAAMPDAGRCCVFSFASLKIMR